MSNPSNTVSHQERVDRTTETFLMTLGKIKDPMVMYDCFWIAFISMGKCESYLNRFMMHKFQVEVLNPAMDAVRNNRQSKDC